MKLKLNTLLICVFLMTGSILHAQTADEIIQNYLENTGGADNWASLKGIKITAKANQQGMEFPLEIVQLADGRQYTKITFQGMSLYQGVYDGETLWNTNFQSMKAEKADAEQQSNFKKQVNDFPDPFLNYKDKGYTVELIGTETIDGAETFKIKLTKEPILIDGKDVEDVSYYYFDSEAFVPLATDSDMKKGPMAGQVQRITQSDYQEVDGLYFAFSMTQGVKDGPSSPLTIESIELNPEVDESVFKFPEQ